jgi:hypothetical protein
VTADKRIDDLEASLEAVIAASDGDPRAGVRVLFVAIAISKRRLNAWQRLCRPALYAAW